MARETNPRSTPKMDEHIRAKIEQEGLNWARQVSEVNAWDCMVLTLGIMIYLQLPMVSFS